MKVGRRRSWTKEQDQFVRDYYRQPMTRREIAKALGKSYASVGARVAHLALTDRFVHMNWTPEVDHRLKWMYAIAAAKSIARRMNVSLHAIRWRIGALEWTRDKAVAYAIEHNLGGDAMYKRRWTPKDVRELRELHRVKSIKAIADQLRRTERSVYLKVQRLGLAKKSHPDWTPEKILQLKYLYAKLRAEDIAIAFGVSVNVIRCALTKRGITKKVAYETRDEIDSQRAAVATATELCLRD